MMMLDLLFQCIQYWKAVPLSEITFTKIWGWKTECRVNHPLAGPSFDLFHFFALKKLPVAKARLPTQQLAQTPTGCSPCLEKKKNRFNLPHTVRLTRQGIRWEIAQFIRCGKSQPMFDRC